MAYEPDHINLTPTPDTLPQAAVRINDNLDAIAADLTDHDGRIGNMEANASGLAALVAQAGQFVELEAEVTELQDADTAQDGLISDLQGAVAERVQLANQLGGSEEQPDVRGIRETGGPTLLEIGEIPDGDLLGREGNDVVGVSRQDEYGGELSLVDATHLAWAFRSSNQIVLFDPTLGKWRLVELTAAPGAVNTSLDMGGDALTYDTIYDVFLNYTSLTAATLEFAKWSVSTAGTSARAGTWATGQAYKIGQRKTNSGSTYACLENHTSGTFATDLAAGKWVLVESDGLGLLNGRQVYANSGAWRGYRYIGIVMLANNSGTPNFMDDINSSFIIDAHRPKVRVVRCYNSTASWTCTAASAQESNNGTGQIRAKFLSQAARRLSIDIMLTGSSSGGSTGAVFQRCMVNGVSAGYSTYLHGLGAYALPMAATGAAVAGYNEVTIQEWQNGDRTLTANGTTAYNVIVVYGS